MLRCTIKSSNRFGEAYIAPRETALREPISEQLFRRNTKMAMMTTNVAGFSGLNASVARWFADVKDGAQKRALYERTVRELSELSTQELEDLGLNRYSIQDVAFEAVYGK
jgi:uncharacterized protein YjiS (DUF1127 family)